MESTTPLPKYGDVSTVLEGTTVLVTGAAGFVGTALLYRLLLDPEFRVRRVLALIRGKTMDEAAAKLPPVLRRLAHPVDTEHADPRLVILLGDCSRSQLGLEGRSLQAAREADILIHAAGETRFMLSLSGALECITDLAYMTARFSLGSSNIKTHIHLSTTYVGWFMKNGSTVTEDLLQTDLGPDSDGHDDHVNTYLHVKTLAEECVNALFKPQAGRPPHAKAARILRLSTLGAAASFPSPGCGACQTSTPVSAALAAVPVRESEEWAPFREAFLDVLPVDVAVNQILALTAAAHRNHSLPRAAPSHPRNIRNPVNAPGTNVPVYHVASGLPPMLQLKMATLNRTEVKISRPYVKEASLVGCYRPFIEKTVHFDVTRALAAMSVTPSPMASDSDCAAGAGEDAGNPAPSDTSAARRFPLTVENLGSSSDRIQLLPAPIPSHSSSAGSTLSEDGNSSSSDAALTALTSPSSLDAQSVRSDAGESLFTACRKGREEEARSAAAAAAAATTFNLDRDWVDTPVDCGALEVDSARLLEARFGKLSAAKDSQAWLGYLGAVRDEMERAMALADEESWVD